jgi:ribose transport system ATP-binding protein
MQGPPDSIALLVLDEPTAAMPAGDVEMVYELVRRARVAGAAVLYVSHHLDEVFALADRVTVLRDGRAVATLAVDSSSPGQLADLMSGGHVDVGVRPEPRPADQPLLELRGVSADVLRDFDLTLHAGEIVGVAGVDGSGRDEVAAAIFGGRPRRGDVRCGDIELPACRPDVAIAASIGYVPGDRAAAGLILDMNIRENFTLPSLRDFWRHLVLNNRRERADVSAWNRRLGVRTETAEKPVSVLSGGNQQKVVIGKWLRLEPKVLLLDEPTQGVDVAAKADIHRLLDDYAGRGAAVLVSSSDETELVRLCSRVLVLDHGRVTAEFAGGQVNRAAIARASLGGQPRNHQQNGTAS